MKDKFDSFLKKYNITGRVAVAVSGGADSMALSWLCHKHSSLSLLGLTVDHRLRSESQKEAESVQNIFSKWGVPHRILTWENPSQKSLEEEARFARYELLVEACQKEEIKTLFVAHHQGDQVETFFLNLMRGSGLKGLSGIKEMSVQKGVQFARPLLDISKKEIYNFCNQEKISYVEDPMNQDEIYQRVKIRKLLEELNLPDSRICETMSRLQKSDETCDYFMDAFLKKTQESEGVFLRSGWQQIPEEIACRAIRKTIQEIGQTRYPPEWHPVKRIYHEILTNLPFKMTLGKCIVEGNDKILVKKEK